MSQASVAEAPTGSTTAPLWNVTKRQWIWVIVIFIGTGLAFYSYVKFNAIPPKDRWPAFYATDPATGQLVQPLTGADPYQTFVLKSWLDEKIPFVPILALPYISFLVIAPIFVPLFTLAVAGFRRFVTLGVALIASQLILDVAYYLFQTNVLRTATVPDGFLGWMVRQVQGNDLPFNGYPSGHCTWTTITIIALWRLRKRTPKISWIFMCWIALVYPATVMLQQHYLMDVYAGIFVGFATYWAVMFIVERPKLVPRDELNEAQPAVGTSVT
ncbi:MAG: phosphatase PAP2 family protein [Actinomycetes bacterium]